MTPPGNHEVGNLAGTQNHGYCGQEVGFGKQHKICRRHDLLGFES